MTQYSHTSDRGGFSGDGLVLSCGYSRVMAEQVLPFINSRRRDTTLTRGGIPLFVSRFIPEETPRGTVMIVHGFTENADKYAELIHSLLKNRWCVLAYDQRGHGRSWRRADLSDLSVTHVDRFDEYVEDMQEIVSRLLDPMPGPKMLFCHSMGGAVSALYLENGGAAFERAVFSSPMIAPNLGGMPVPLVRAVCRVPIAMGRGHHRAFTSRPYSGPEDFASSCASGRERFEWYETLRAATPEFQNNGPTYRWALESMNVTEKLLAPGMPERISIPVRIFGAENDSSVIPSAQEAFAKRLRDGSLTLVPGSKHEIFRSPDSVLFPWWHTVLSIFAGSEA